MPNCWEPTIRVAELSGRDTRTVKKAADEHQITPKKGAKGALLWPCPEILDALYSAPERRGYDFEKERLTKGQADKTELEIEVLRGNLVPRELVVEGVGRMVSVARARLLSIPTKLAAVAGMMTEAELADAATEAITEALNGLAARSWAAVDAAAETDDSGVGGPKPAVEPRSERRARPVEH